MDIRCVQVLRQCNGMLPSLSCDVAFSEESRKFVRLSFKIEDDEKETPSMFLCLLSLSQHATRRDA